MLVLIATQELQGAVPGDYAHTVDGELVTPVVLQCDSATQCGCERGFPGLASSVATTTAMVVDRPGVTESDLRKAVFDWLDRDGWIGLAPSNSEAMVAEHVDSIIDVCAIFPVGSVLSRCGSKVMARSMPEAA